MKNIKLVVIIQCAIAKRRCSGFYCMDCFYKRKGGFTDYPKEKNIQYMMFECGGCCGKEISSLLGHLSRKLKEDDEIKRDEVAIHLASCMVTDNHHYDRCPHIDYIKQLIDKQGYKNVIEGTLFATISEKKRKSGEYSSYLVDK